MKETKPTLRSSTSLWSGPEQSSWCLQWPGWTLPWSRTSPPSLCTASPWWELARPAGRNRQCRGDWWTKTTRKVIGCLSSALHLWYYLCHSQDALTTALIHREEDVEYYTSDERSWNNLFIDLAHDLLRISSFWVVSTCWFYHLDCYICIPMLSVDILMDFCVHVCVSVFSYLQAKCSYIFGVRLAIIGGEGAPTVHTQFDRPWRSALLRGLAIPHYMGHISSSYT